MPKFARVNHYRWKVQSKSNKKIHEVNKITRPVTGVTNATSDKHKDYDQRLQKTYLKETLLTEADLTKGIYSTESKLGKKLLEKEEALNVGDTFQIYTDQGEHKTFKVIMKELITENNGS